jgi:hypothetical protein
LARCRQAKALCEGVAGSQVVGLVMDEVGDRTDTAAESSKFALSAAQGPGQR